MTAITNSLTNTNLLQSKTAKPQTTIAADAAVTTTGAVGSTAQNPFVLNDSTNWVSWTSAQHPQYISYKGNIYKFDKAKEDDANQIRYKAVNKLGDNQNMLYVSFTGQSRQDVIGHKTERVQVGTQQVQVGTERVQTGTQRVKVGERVVGTTKHTENVKVSLSREIDGKNATGAIGDMLTRGTTQLSDANQFFNSAKFASYRVSSLTGEDNQVTSGTVDPTQQKLCADDMFVAGDPKVGGKGNNYATVDVTPQTGYMTMYEDGSDTGRKVTVNSHADIINTQGNKAFTEYGFVIQDDNGQKTKASLSGGQLNITAPDGTVKTLKPGETYTIGSEDDPVARFYYADMPGGENGATEQRLVFDSFEKPTPDVVAKLTAAGMSEADASALRNRSQATFGFRIPDGKGSYRSPAGVAGNALKTTTNGVKTYYDAHFSKPDCQEINVEKCTETPVKEDVYKDVPVYTEKPKYVTKPVYENRDCPIYGTVYEITKNLASPLVLDLDGKGIQTTAPNRTMDINGDGTSSTVSWFGAGNGVLAFDANKNGKIDINGRELFGNNSDINGDGQADGNANGFEALKRLASQTLGQSAVADNVLDASEIRALENKAGLRIITQGDQAQTLSSLGITKLNLAYAETATTDAYGNQTRQQGSFERTLSDGSTASRAMADVWLLQQSAAAGTGATTETPAANEPSTPAKSTSNNLIGSFWNANFLQQLRNLLGRFIR